MDEQNNQTNLPEKATENKAITQAMKVKFFIFFLFLIAICRLVQVTPNFDRIRTYGGKYRVNFGEFEWIFGSYSNYFIISYRND